MAKDKALIPVEQKLVEFYDDRITAVMVEKQGLRQVYVPVRPICEFLGVSWTGQRRRINRDPVLSVETRGVNVTFTPGGRQEMICLPLDYLSGFLFGINPARAKPEVQDRLIRYQRECYKVLAEAFQEGRLTADPEFDQLLQQTDNYAVQAYQMALAVVKLARNQILVEARLDSHEERLEQMETKLGDPGRHITPEQASQLSQAVKAVAMALSKQSGRNEYGGVYGELYRCYQIPAYRELPAGKYEDAMNWLNEWLQSLVGDEPF